MALFSFLGSPAVLAAKDSHIQYLENRIRELELEHQGLVDRLLERGGIRPLTEAPPPMSPPMQREVVQPYEDWTKQSMKDELAELAELASQDEAYEALYEEAVLRYNDTLSNRN